MLSNYKESAEAVRVADAGFGSCFESDTQQLAIQTSFAASSTSKAAPPITSAISNNSGAMALAFRTDEKSWATLRVVDEAEPRTWASR